MLFVFCCFRLVYSGTNNTFSMPVILSFWGKEENKANVYKALARRGYKLDTDPGKSTGTVIQFACISARYFIFFLTSCFMSWYVVSFGRL